MTKVIFKKSAYKKRPIAKNTKALVVKTVKQQMAKVTETKIPNYYRYTALTDNLVKVYNLLYFMNQGTSGTTYIGESYFCKSININYILKQIAPGSTTYQNTRHFRMMVIQTEQQLTATEINVAQDLIFKQDAGDVTSGVYAPLSFVDRHKVRVVYEKHISVNREYPTQVKDYRGTINVKVNKKLTLDENSYLGRHNYYLVCAFYDGSVTNTQVALQSDWQVNITDM